MSTTNPRVLAKPVKVKLAEGERILRSKRGPQAHLVAAGETLTVCDINSAGWQDVEDVTAKGEVTCPVCAKRNAAGQRVSNRALRESQKASGRGGGRGNRGDRGRRRGGDRGGAERRDSFGGGRGMSLTRQHVDGRRDQGTRPPTSSS